MKDSDIIENIKNKINLNKCLNRLYDNYYGSLERWIIQNSGQKADAEDVIQETMVSFIQIVQNEKFRGESSIKSFLYAIAKNIWFAKIKKQTADMKRAFLWNEDADEYVDEINNRILANENLKLISSVLENLGEVCSNILKKFYYEELSLIEILPFTNFENEQVLRNKKSKCMKALIEKLENNTSLKETIKQALKLN